MDRNVSVNLRRILKEKNLTQAKLAARCGLSEATISNCVNCNLGDKGPRDDTLELICRELGITKDMLYAEIEDPIVAETTTALKQVQTKRSELEDELHAKDEAIRDMTHQVELMQTALKTNNERHQDTFKFMRRSIKTLAVAFAVVVIMLIIVSFYAGFSFFAFDMLDPSKGIYRG